MLTAFPDLNDRSDDEYVSMYEADRGLIVGFPFYEGDSIHGQEEVYK